MKQQILSFRALLYVAMATTFSSCFTDEIPAQSTCVHVIYDVTQASECRPAVSSLLPLFDFDGGDTYAEFKLTILRGRLLNAAVTITQDDIPGTESKKSRLRRSECIDTFRSGIETQLRTFPLKFTEPPLRVRKETYKTFASEIWELARSRAGRKVIVVYSGLEEEQPDFSTSSKESVELMKTDPIAVGEKLLRGKSLPDVLPGLTVIFVFNGNTEKENETFRHMSAVYKELLLDRGAQVIIQSQSNRFEI